MVSVHRSALFALALATSFPLVTPSMAESLSAQSERVDALSRAGKYAEALPLAQALVAQVEKGPESKNLAGALNNLAEVYAAMGRDADAEPLYKRALAIMEKVVGLESVDDLMADLDAGFARLNQAS